MSIMGEFLSNAQQHDGSNFEQIGWGLFCKFFLELQMFYIFVHKQRHALI